jgi:hypothetical protein
MCARQAGETSMEHKDLNQSLAERRTRREHRLLPKRYWDIAPEPLAPLLPPGLQDMVLSMQAGATAPQSLSPSSSPAPTPLVRKILQSNWDTEFNLAVLATESNSMGQHLVHLYLVRIP